MADIAFETETDSIHMMSAVVCFHLESKTKQTTAQSVLDIVENEMQFINIHQHLLRVIEKIKDPIRTRVKKLLLQRLNMLHTNQAFDRHFFVIISFELLRKLT